MGRAGRDRGGDADPTRYNRRAQHVLRRRCQTPEILGDIEAALGCIEYFARQSEPAHVDLLLFPECFLQGYLVEEGHLRQHALDLESAAFASILQRLIQFGRRSSSA